MKKYFILLALIPFIAFADGDYKVSICKNCYAPESFRSAAITTGYKNITVVVINPETGGAKAYLVAPPDTAPSDFSYAKPKNLPADVQPAINEYFALRYHFENYTKSVSSKSNNLSTGDSNNTLFSNMQNGCGTPSHWSHPVIPNFPFYEACNSHDMCYSGSDSKSFCDQKFLFEMDRITYEMSSNNSYSFLNSPTATILFNFLMFMQADIYYFAVAESKNALTAYCESTQNSDPAECNTSDFDRIESKGQRSGLFVYSNKQVSWTCDVYDVFNSSGEYSGSYTTNCRFSFIP